VAKGLARPSEHETLAVVLRGREYSESDKLVVFLTSDFGKIAGIAKGAKRSRRRFVNTLEPFSHVRLRFRQSRATDLAFVLACDLVESFKNLLTDFARYAHAAYAVELVDRVTQGRESTAETYRTLRQLLDRINRGSIGTGLLRAFELDLLRQTGYLPRLGSCQRCGCDLTIEENAWFLPGGGGLRCGRCRQGAAAFFISREALAFLLTVERQGLAGVSAEGLSLSPPAAREARVVTRGLLGATLGGPLTSDQLLAELDALSQ